MRTRRFKLILLTFALSSLFACTAQVKRELYFRITWTDYSGRGVAIQRIVDTYNEQSQTHHMNLVSGDEAIDAIEIAMETYKYNGIFVLPYRYVRYLGEQDKLIELSEAFTNERSLFDPSLIELGEVDDMLYGLPWVNHFIAMIYNQDLLNQAGIDPHQIKDLDALVRALQAVEDKTDAHGIGLVGAEHHDLSWMINQFIYGFGSQLVDETGKVVLINNERSIEAITFYRDGLGTYAQETWLEDDGVDVMDAFREGKIAFEFQGIWGLTDIEKNGNKFATGVIKLEDIGLSPEVGPLMMSIGKDMDPLDLEAAYDFMRFMVSEYAQSTIMKGEYSPEHDYYYPFRVPARKLLVDQLILSDQSQYIPFASGFTHPSIDVPTARWQIIKDTIYVPGLHRVMRNELSIEEFLSQVELDGNLILNP